MEKRKNNKNRLQTFFDLLYYLIVSFLIIICISIIVQQHLDSNKIPNIFGFKLFMINKDYMHETLEEGDLVITKNVDPNELKLHDIVAFRNSQNLVTIHEIIQINNEDSNSKFVMKTLENEVQYNKYVNEPRIEGILCLKIPYLGKIILFIIEPIVLAMVIAVILIVGFVLYLKAKKEDEKLAENVYKKDEIKDEKNGKYDIDEIKNDNDIED
ncbi:MAG: signal peptidase I [Clostridia bacterium]|nr:signal peptidase I [Clostridia bacterium]